MRGFMYGQMCMWRLRVNRVEQKSACAPDARLWAGKTTRLSQKSEKKNSDEFLSNSW
jgi:hypothetical protein